MRSVKVVFFFVCGAVATTLILNSSSNPSGLAMPTGDLPGWHQVLADDFNGTTLDSCWGAYQGVPGGSPVPWEPSHVIVGDGMVQLQTYQDLTFGGQWVTGGMSSAPCLKQQYGKYLVRFRMDQATGVKYAILLWPSTQPWPCGGEIDFGEDGGGNRSDTSLTVHYCDTLGNDAILPQQDVASDFSAWHTIGVEWTAGQIVWQLDGANIGTVLSSHVPANLMELDIQAEGNTTCGDPYFPCIDSTTPAQVNLQVDWVVAYSRDFRSYLPFIIRAIFPIP